jgi:WD40-like Beta Propeller Repeat
MRVFLRALIILNGLTTLTMQAWADAEIVIAIRYLQAEGTSHSHLYLYREDGKLLRQLTNDNSRQDSAPIFAPDGSTIVFTREKSNNAREFWSIDPLGKALKKLEAAPDWYVAGKSSPYFTNVEPKESASPSLSASAEESPSPSATPIPRYKSPDGSVELILREDQNDEDDQIDGPGHGKHYLLRDLKTGTETEFDKIPGFYGVFGLLHDNQNENQHFLFEGPLRLAFFDLHLNSTDRDTVFALDLTSPRLVRLSPNWAAPMPLPGEAAFLTFTEDRYVPIAGSKCIGPAKTLVSSLCGVAPNNSS